MFCAHCNLCIFYSREITLTERIHAYLDVKSSFSFAVYHPNGFHVSLERRFTQHAVVPVEALKVDLLCLHRIRREEAYAQKIQTELDQLDLFIGELRQSGLFEELKLAVDADLLAHDVRIAALFTEQGVEEPVVCELVAYLGSLEVVERRVVLWLEPIRA